MIVEHIIGKTRFTDLDFAIDVAILAELQEVLKALQKKEQPL